MKPTINGIREGRDEVLEEGLRQTLGHDTPAAELKKLYRPSSSAGSASKEASK